MDDRPIRQKEHGDVTYEIPLTVEDAAAALRQGVLSSVELTSACLARADALDPVLGTYLLRFDEHALAAAATADQELAAGVDRGPLHGIPVGMKDILAMPEGPTTAQSLVLDREWGAGKEGPVVRRLKAAGAVITGKVTTMEFACGMPDPAKPFPLPRNPWDTNTWPGGSSSGTGSGVAAGMFLTGIGTDTGGSIRIPAAFCGVSGLMPTFGRVPKSGCVPLGFTLDHIGPLARSAWDCGAMLDVLAGYDPSDPNAVTSVVAEHLTGIDDGIAGMRIGVMREFHFPEDSDPAAEIAFDLALDVLEAQGAELIDVSIPLYQEVVAAMMITASAEMGAYHLPDAQTRWDDYFTATRVGLARGAFATGADYVQAQRVRRVGQLALAQLYEEVDVIVTPTACAGATSYDDILDPDADPMALFATVFTPYWDAVGNPVLVVPMGFTADGLPLSLQLAGRPFEESTLVRVGRSYQSATDFHVRVPALAAGALV
jgi:aspartyl-tRNA(Asn)/glutamyl-tRNA(Gln) amidotransferase subunit A